MVDKSLEEIKSYFEKAKEEYKKQLFSFEDDLNYYKEFLQLIGKTEDDALLEVKNCKDYLKCRKILVDSFLHHSSFARGREKGDFLINYKPRSFGQEATINRL